MTPVEEIEAALRHIDSHDREQWVRMGAAIKTELGDTEGFDVWNAWSAEASNYNPRAAASTWRSLKAGFVNIGTLFYEARQNGYEPSQEYVPPTAAEIAERRRANEIAQQKAEEERKQQMAEAKIFAQKRYSSLEPIRELNHDYLVNKGIADHALLKQVRTDGNNLVIPLKIMGEIVGIQEINKSGRKTFNKGLELKGSSLVMGAWANRHKGIVLTEGYATAASIHKATGLTTVICFAGFNLAEVAKRFPKNLDVPIIIAADNDLPDRNGNISGMQYAMAAKEVLGDKATIIEPSFTEQEFKEFESLYGSRPSDFNDLHKLHGLNAVKIQLQPTQEIEVEKKVAHLGSVSNRDQGVDLYITDDDRYLIEESFHALNGEQWGKETASKTYDTEEEVKEYLKNSPLGHSTETLNELYSKARFRQDSTQTIETNLKHEINMNENFNKSELTEIAKVYTADQLGVHLYMDNKHLYAEEIFHTIKDGEKTKESRFENLGELTDTEDFSITPEQQLAIKDFFENSPLAHSKEALSLLYNQVDINRKEFEEITTQIATLSTESREDINITYHSNMAGVPDLNAEEINELHPFITDEVYTVEINKANDSFLLRERQFGERFQENFYAFKNANELRLHLDNSEFIRSNIGNSDEFLEKLYEKMDKRLTQIEQEFSVEKPEIEVEENSISPDVEKIFQQRMSEREKSNELDDIELETQHLKKPETESEIESTEQSQTPETEEVIDVEKELSKRIVLDHNYEPPYELKQKYVFTEKGDYINNNGDLFFKDHGAELKTVKTDIDTVRDMLAVAETKGWSSIDLKGTKEFKRLAFLEAESRGIKTTGYLPTERDMAILNQMIEERSRNKIQQSEKTPDSEQTANKERTIAEKEILQENGKLVKHGVAPYQFDEKEKPNYYVEVEMPDGKIERYWGVDLERAIEEAQAEIGHEIELQNLGRQPVTVSKNIYDDKGNFQRVEEIETHRNKWEITNHSLEKEASEKELDIGQQQAEKDKAINQNRATAEAVIEDSARVDAHGADIPMRGVGGQEIQDEVLAFMNGLTPKQKGLNKSGLFKLRMHKELLKPIISGLNSKQRDQAIRNFNETMDKSINGQNLNYPPTRTQERSTPTHTPAPTQARVAEREPELER